MSNRKQSAPAAKVARVQEVRRSNAAAPHRNKKRYHRPSQTRALRGAY